MTLFLALVPILFLGAFFGIAEAIKDSIDSESSRRLDDRPCVKWGAIFDVPLDGKNVIANCRSPSGKRVCCAAMDDTRGMRGIGIGYDDNIKATNSGKTNIFGSKEEVEPVDKRRLAIEFLDSAHDLHAKSAASHGDEDLGGCKITKEYFSSPHELRELAEAERISRIGTSEISADAGRSYDDGSHLPTAVHDKRLKAVIDYITSEASITNATRWLGRVKEHMSSEEVPSGSAVDLEFLSRYKVTRSCGGKVVKIWTEWIEPMTLTTRHPFSYSTCKKIYQHFGKVPRIGRSNVDYVLLKSGADLYREEGGDIPQQHQEGTRRHFLLDAGTSTFESSLAWFTCAYSQRKVSFDGVYAWEKTLLEPSDYWARVPPKWIPYWHFYNDAIQADEKAHNSPVRMLKSIAGPRDFVAWKLDIDHPETEMPIAMSLLSDKSISSHIDEFFFELHYRCEVMTSCGWGKRVPEMHSGLLLERATVMKYFIDLRKAGIRAHAWP